MSEFEEFWKTVTTSLTRPRKIRNWTKDRGYLGRGDFEASYDGGNRIRVVLDNWNLLNIAKNEFEYIYKNWSAYTSGRIPRGQLRDDSRFTKYTISILKEFRV